MTVYQIISLFLMLFVSFGPLITLFGAIRNKQGYEIGAIHMAVILALVVNFVVSITGVK